MTLTEKILVALILVGLVMLVFVWPLGLLLLGATAYIAAVSQKVIPKDPATMAIIAPFDRPSDQVLIAKPRIAFAYGGFPLYENLIPIPMGKINFDFVFDEVTTGLRDKADDDDSPPQSGGRVQVQVSWTGIIKRTAKAAYDFVMAGREEGAFDIFEDRLGEEVRTHALRKRWETFIGEKKPLTEKLVDASIPWLDDLGFEPGKLNVKNIEPEGGLKVDAEKSAREEQQRRRERVDSKTRLDNAKGIQRAARERGEAMTLSEAMKVERTQRGLNQEIVIRTDGGKAPPATVVAGAMRLVRAHHDGHEGDQGGNDSNDNDGDN